jgi:hypothetical protein
VSDEFFRGILWGAASGALLVIGVSIFALSDTMTRWHARKARRWFGRETREIAARGAETVIDDRDRCKCGDTKTGKELGV